MAFGNRLRELRLERKMTQEDLAKIAKVARATIGRYETDERFPDQEVLKKLANFFEVSIDWLLGETDIRYPKGYEDQLIGHKEIEKILEDIGAAFLNTEGLLLNGELASEETKRKIIDAMKIGMEMAKKEAKGKYHSR